MSLKEKDYIRMMAVRKRKFLEEHLRPFQNEWMLEEMEEFGDEVNNTAYRAFKQGKITKQEYQETVDAARSEWTKLYQRVKDYEDQEGYIARLTGEVSYSD